MSQEQPPSFRKDDPSRAQTHPQQDPHVQAPPGYYPPYHYLPVRPTNTFAILALVFSFIVPPLGIAFGVMGSRQIKMTGEQGEGLAKAGFIVGIVVSSMWVLYFLFMMLFFTIPLIFIPLSTI